MTQLPDDLEQIEPPRGLLPGEQALIERLLEHPFEGRDEMRSQLSGARVRAEGKGDTRTIVFHLASDALRAVTARRIPIEAQAMDSDGVPIEILLHVLDGLAAELEIYRVDGEPLQQRDLSLVRLGSVSTW